MEVADTNAFQKREKGKDGVDGIFFSFLAPDGYVRINIPIVIITRIPVDTYLEVPPASETLRCGQIAAKTPSSYWEVGRPVRHTIRVDNNIMIAMTNAKNSLKKAGKNPCLRHKIRNTVPGVRNSSAMLRHHSLGDSDMAAQERAST